MKIPSSTAGSFYLAFFHGIKDVKKSPSHTASATTYNHTQPHCVFHPNIWVSFSLSHPPTRRPDPKRAVLTHCPLSALTRRKKASRCVWHVRHFSIYPPRPMKTKLQTAPRLAVHYVEAKKIRQILMYTSPTSQYKKDHSFIINDANEFCFVTFFFAFYLCTTSVLMNI